MPPSINRLGGKKNAVTIPANNRFEGPTSSMPYKKRKKEENKVLLVTTDKETSISVICLFIYKVNLIQCTCSSLKHNDELSFFYTPVFRRVVLWYGDVCPSVHPSVRPSGSPSGSPSVTVFRTFLLHALTY